ncbi:hypothetical protein CY35_09G060500 [Sphagnum magellanicum]|nr:hypothetical protein CY35_09G060500 [Sphagnum magellanicum]
MQCIGFLVDKETKDYRGVETLSGQHLYSGKLITGPSFCVGSVQPRLTEGRGSEKGIAKFSSSEYASTNTESLSNRRNITPYKVACCICITDQSLQPGLSVLQQHWWCEPCSWGQGLKFVPMARRVNRLGILWYARWDFGLQNNDGSDRNRLSQAFSRARFLTKSTGGCKQCGGLRSR